MRTWIAAASIGMALCALTTGALAAQPAPAAAPASAPAAGAPNPAMDKDLADLEREWAHITYEVPDSDDRFDQLQPLLQKAAAVVARYPNRAEPLIWAGIITSEEAADASMLNALSHAEAAKSIFEAAERIDPNALHGAIPMSLGVLYYRVPGSPFGFGDDDMARALLEKALAMDPDGLDINYFYGDFLMEQDEYQKARDVLTHALQAPVEPTRPVWEAGRRGEVQALLAKANRKLAD